MDVSETYLRTAEYFAGRAKRARSHDDRARFLDLVRKYRAMAAQDQKAEAPKPSAAGPTASVHPGTPDGPETVTE
jgi:hypothetical protein